MLGSGSYTNDAYNFPKDFVSGSDLILGDNWSPFDLQVYGSYYESISACELQPQRKKRLYINGGLLDITHDNTIYESSVIPVSDRDKVVLAGHRHVTTNVMDPTGNFVQEQVTEVCPPTGIANGVSRKRNMDAAGDGDDGAKLTKSFRTQQ